MTNHPNRSNNVYTIVAYVSRPNGSHRIEWEYEGRGSGTYCWNTWRQMKESNATCDTREPFISATLYRNGAVVEQVG